MKGFGFVRYSSQAEAEKAVKAIEWQGICYLLCSLLPIQT